MTKSATRLLEFARQNPDGFTYVDIKNSLDWSHSRTAQVVRKLREELADTGETLICTPQAPYTPWLYRLTSESDPVEAWELNRKLDMESRLATLLYVARVWVKTTRGRTDVGKRARMYLKYFGRLLEDMEELSAEAAR